MLMEKEGVPSESKDKHKALEIWFFPELEGTEHTTSSALQFGAASFVV